MAKQRRQEGSAETGYRRSKPRPGADPQADVKNVTAGNVACSGNAIRQARPLVPCRTAVSRSLNEAEDGEWPVH
jgi:hypothetical protein